MTQYTVTGMSCAACSARVEKAVSAVPGVETVSVSLLTNSMGVEGSAESAAIIEAVVKAGYGASEKSRDVTRSSGTGRSSAAFDEAALADKETPKLKRRLFSSLGFLLVLMYFSMGHMMWGWPIPSWFNGNHLAIGLLQMLLTIIVMVINQKFFISGFKGLLHRAPNMDTLVAMGSSAAFIWSTYVLFAMTKAQQIGDVMQTEHLMMDLYFESAAMILTLITVGKMLEARSKGKTTDALKSLMKLAPKTARILINGKETEVPVEQVEKENVFLVRPGDNIPVDGVILEGSSAVNESALTGESVPVDKQVGDAVSAGTINQSGFLTCYASRVGEDTTLAQIIQMVSDAAATKAPIAKIADKVSGVFVPVVISIAAFTFVLWMLLRGDVGFALARAISVLVISCPCALGLATPVAIMVGNGIGARNGVLFKTAASLEAAGRMQIVVLDKTGTITKGQPQVTDLLPAEGISEWELAEAAYAIEQKSEHPLAQAVIAFAIANQVPFREVQEFQALVGSGVSAVSHGITVNAERVQLLGGSGKFIRQHLDVPTELQEQERRLSEQGKTPLFFAENGKLLGIIAVADVMKNESPQAIRELRSMGIRVVMLTGDNERTAEAIGRAAGVDEVIAGVLPEGKESVIRALREQAPVAMVGDGINDAPALTRADTGIAIGAGTDVAIDAADVVLVKSRLTDVTMAIRLSRAVIRNIKENLFWAFCYNTIGIPLAAGALIPFGITLNPMFGAAAMSLSSFCVVTNALRLNFFRGGTENGKSDTEVSKKTEDRSIINEDAVILLPPRKENRKGEPTMKLTIEGMMCPHCEKHCKEALEAIGVTVLSISHAEKCAEIEKPESVTEEQLRAAVAGAGYVMK